MKVLAAAFLVGIALAGTVMVENADSPLITDEFVEQINAAQSSWTASREHKATNC